VPRLGSLNLHASLLPKYRGAAPIAWAIFHGEEETGVTVIRMTPKVDAGDILLQARTPIGPEETAGELQARLAAMAADLVVQAVEGAVQGTLPARPQDPTLATRAPKLRKEMGLIHWNRTARQIVNQIRAFQPWPGAYTYWEPRPGKVVRLLIHRARLSQSEPGGRIQAEPGVIVQVRPTLLVQTGGGPLELLELQPEGKRIMTAEEFVRGYRLEIGQRMGSKPQED
jgi:methionyl-tRNA formyltransferase